jgi:DNA modification methylase
MLEVNKIYNLPCEEGLKKIEDESIDAIVTDPPYGIGFNYHGKKDVSNNPEEYWKWLQPIYKEMLRVLKPGGFMAIWQTQLYFKYFWEWFGENIHIYIGAKNFVQIRKTPIVHGYDPIIMKYKKGKPLRPKKQYRSIDFYVANTASYVTNTKAIERQHPCPRPIDQVKVIIDNFVIENGLVLDCFMGSGTTAIACIETDRKYIGFEKEKRYYDLANFRIQKHQLQLRIM